MADTYGSENNETNYRDIYSPTLTEGIVDLKKFVISNKAANDFLDRNFSELIQTGLSVEVKKFFDIYQQLFYKINKSNSPNKESHFDLVHESLHYFNNYVDYCAPQNYTQEINCDQEIDRLVDSLETINQEIFDNETKIEKTNLVYSNGTFLRGEGQNVEGLPVWIMIQAEKREIKNREVYNTLKQLLGFPLDTPDDTIQTTLTFEELNGIDDGLPITSDLDIVRIDQTADADVDFDVELTDFFNYRESQFVCLCGAAMGDPDGILPLEDIFKWGQQNNGIDNQCHIHYYDLFSQQQLIKLNPGEVSDIIKHRTDEGDIQGQIQSVPVDWSDEFTPLISPDGTSYTPEGHMFAGVGIFGFTREIRYSYNDIPLTPDQGIQTITAGDLNGDGISGDQYNHSTLTETYGENFAVYYYDSPLALSREVKLANYVNTAGGICMDKSDTLPRLRMITDGENGLYHPFPPQEYPSSDHDFAGGNIGYGHQHSLFEGPFSLENLKTNDPNIFVKKCIIGGLNGKRLDRNDDVVNGSNAEIVLRNLNVREEIEVEDEKAPGGISIEEGDLLYDQKTKRGGIKVYPNPRPPGYQGLLATGAYPRHGGVFPYSGPTSADNYNNDERLGHEPLVYDVYQRYQDPANNGDNFNPDHGVVRSNQIYGAPIFEWNGIYFVVGRHIRDRGAMSSEIQYMTFLPLEVSDRGPYWGQKKLINYGPVLFRLNQGLEGAPGGFSEDHPMWINLKQIYAEVASGGTGYVNTPNWAGSQENNVRCAFPGFCHYFYEYRLNSKTSGRNTPYNGAGDVRYGGMERQLDLNHF